MKLERVALRRDSAEKGDRVYQSWDTALTDGKSSDYSVCITFLARGMDYYIIDILRVRVNYPELRRLIYHQWRTWGAANH